MKKVLFLLTSLLLWSISVFAQDGKSVIAEKKNEFRVDVLTAVAFGKANISYERFLNDNWSLGLTGSFAYSDKFDEDFDSGYRSTLPKTEFVPYVRYRISQSFKSYYFIEAFVSANSGDTREIVRESLDGVAAYRINKEEYFDMALGASLGYKVYFADSIALEFLVGGGYNLIDTDKSPDLISRIGINLGYRF